MAALKGSILSEKERKYPVTAVKTRIQAQKS
jgi:hypothetical protein